MILGGDTDQSDPDSTEPGLRQGQDGLQSPRNEQEKSSKLRNATTVGSADSV